MFYEIKITDLEVDFPAKFRESLLKAITLKKNKYAAYTLDFDFTDNESFYTGGKEDKSCGTLHIRELKKDYISNRDTAQKEQKPYYSDEYEEFGDIALVLDLRKSSEGITLSLYNRDYASSPERGHNHQHVVREKLLFSHDVRNQEDIDRFLMRVENMMSGEITGGSERTNLRDVRDFTDALYTGKGVAQKF